MAKNIRVRKRIAHNKNDPLGGIVNSQNPGCIDFVAKIMSDMDSNLLSKNLTALAETSVNKKSVSQKQHLIGMGQNQKQDTNICKAKRRLGLGKKFPLMEKSQKVLKHLKHNRKMPKPRAHLASLASPDKNNSKFQTRKNGGTSCKTAHSSKSITTNKKSVKRNDPETIKKVVNTSRKTPPVPIEFDKTSSKRGSSRKSQISENVGRTSRRVSPYESVNSYHISPWLNNSISTHEETKQRKVTNKKSETKKCFNDDCSSVSDINEEIRNVFGDSETSDSDFERFVQSQKKTKNLKKRRKKQPTTGRKKIKQQATQTRKNQKNDAKVKCSIQKESDANARKSTRYKKNKCSKDKSNKKGCKKKNAISDDESESEFEFNDKDVYTRDSSEYESDSNARGSNICKESDKSTKADRDNSVFPEDKCELNFNEFDDNDVYTRDSFESMAEDDTVINETSKSPMKGQDLMSESKSNDVADEIESDVVSTCNLNFEVGIESIDMKSNNEKVSTSENISLDTQNTSLPVDNLANKSFSNSPIVIDLSDNESEFAESTSQLLPVKSEGTVINTMPNTSESQSDEESDLEIVDVIITNNEIGNVTEDNNQSVNSTRKQNIIKSEKDPDITLGETKKPQINKDMLKNEAAFSTDICSKLLEADLKSTPSSHNVSDVILNKDIKQERCDDEDIIVLGGDKHSANSADSSQISPTVLSVNGKISTVKRENITNEGDSKGKREKLLFEVACSNLKAASEDKSSKFSSLTVDDMNNMDVKTLLKMFKTEFKTYQEIIETQEAIGHSFRLLENRQAEKLLSLKSAIKSYVGNLENSEIDSDIPLEKIEFSDSRSLECKPGTSSQNSNTVWDAEDGGSELSKASRNFSRDNLVPLSSVQADIKPDVSKLQSVLDSVQKSKEPSNVMSFGEKCVVCNKDALAACQQCAKVFFCSNKCGKAYWDAGHGSLCSQ